jgi:hypothetical protein
LKLYRLRPLFNDHHARIADPRQSICKLPKEAESLTPLCRRYLEGRRFNPDKLSRLWGLKGVGPLGLYRFRIIAPITYHGQVVSFQARDATDRAELRYRACPKDQEARDHKECLYGLDAVPGDRAVVTEGITDVWRLGPGAVATFGVQFSLTQVALLQDFSRVSVLFDSGKEDPEAPKQARKLALMLNAFNVETETVELNAGGDPGKLDQKEADEIMRELLS